METWNRRNLSLRAHARARADSTIGCLRAKQAARRPGAERVDEVPIGRGRERAAISTFFQRGRGGPATLVLEGEPGIGKSALWRHSLSTLGDDWHILTSTPTATDAELGFAVLGDVLGPVLDSLHHLTEPRQRALNIALSMQDPVGRSPSPTSVALATLDLLRAAAVDRPLLIAIDDAPWIDAASARSLHFALRRLSTEAVGVFLTARTTFDSKDPSPLLGLANTTRIRLSPLDASEVEKLLSKRLGMTPPRHLLTRIHEQAGGNPFYALELAHALERRGSAVGPHDPLPIPSSLRGLMAERLSRLSPAGRSLATYTASLRRPTVSLLAALDSPVAPVEALDEIVDAGVVQVDDGAIRFTHPLIASAILADTSSADRHAIHASLANVVTDTEERARHLALAAMGPDVGTAGILDEAATRAAARGAPDAAATFAEDALQLTPADRMLEAQRRAIEAVDHHLHAGDTQAAERVINSRLPTARPGTERASLLWRLAIVRQRDSGFAKAEPLLHDAAEETAADLKLRISIEQELAYVRVQSGDLLDAMVHARTAHHLATRTGEPELIAESELWLTVYRFVAGEGVGERFYTDALALEARVAPDATPLTSWIDAPMVAACLLRWSDRTGAARAKLLERYQRALQQGHEGSLPMILFHLSELEYWAGNWHLSERYAAEGMELGEHSVQMMILPVLTYAVALNRAGRGDLADARAAAEEALRIAGDAGVVTVILMAQSALGFIDLCEGNYAGTDARVGAVAKQMVAMGVGEPGVVRFMADEIEALVGLGRLDDARSMTDYFEERGRVLDRPYALATGARCRALVEAASGDVEGALAAIDRAIVEHQRLEMPLELGRTLLAAGAILRRAKKKKAAREALEEAIDIFERLGARLWVSRARADLDRVAVHATSPADLSPTEHRVADLVAAGHTNREVADALFISVKTVDSNLTRIYRKLHVRSRTELAHAYARDPGHLGAATSPGDRGGL
jgi:DNA-binding CsgD family transcriptional regulator